MNIKSFNEIVSDWKIKGSTRAEAIVLTLEQLEAFERIVNDEDRWNKLIEIFRRGREQDAWLAADWPNGFDELVLCAPLCKLVDWECARCFVGKKQNNFSCASEDSLFGYIAILLSLENRELVKEHIIKIKHALNNDNIIWNMERHEIHIKTNSTDRIES